jgi:type IV pilus assembly protein PilY1
VGNVYRIATNGSPRPDGWTKSLLYAGSQEITADPVVAYAENGSFYIYFGTGAYLEETDMLTTGQQSFLCVYDKHDGLAASKAQLVNQTSSINEIGGYRGWYVDLWNADGERVTQQAVVVAEEVVFTSFTPSEDPCVAGGYSWLYQMRYNDGGRADDPDSDDPGGRSEDIGEGVASYPVVDLSAGEVVVQSSDASIEVAPIQSVIIRMTVRAWQETFEGAGDQAAQAAPETGGLQ